MDLKPIETRYAGCRFRSRLEARWAVFFDRAGIQWEYEPEGFELPSGARYLPDFWLPESRAWFEVKGDTPTERARDVLCEFAQHLPMADDVMTSAGLAISQYLKVAVGDIPRPEDRRTVLDMGIDEYIASGDGRGRQPAWSRGWIWRLIPMNDGCHVGAAWWNECPRGHKWVGWGWCWLCRASVVENGKDYDVHYAAWHGYTTKLSRALRAARSARFGT